MATARIRDLGPRAVPGDLVISSHMDTRCSMRGIMVTSRDSTTPSSSTGQGGRKEDATGIIDPEESQSFLPSEDQNQHSKAKIRGTVKVLTAADIKMLAKDGITTEELLARIVLPLPGTSVEYPTHKASVALLHYRSWLMSTTISAHTPYACRFSFAC